MMQHFGSIETGTEFLSNIAAQTHEHLIKYIFKIYLLISVHFCVYFWHIEHRLAPWTNFQGEDSRLRTARGQQTTQWNQQGQARCWGRSHVVCQLNACCKHEANDWREYDTHDLSQIFPRKSKARPRRTDKGGQCTSLTTQWPCRSCFINCDWMTGDELLTFSSVD